MGAGEFPAGAGLAGSDPVNPASASIFGRAPARALTFDLLTRRFLFNSDGSATDTHPVDQKVVLALGVELGALLAAPTIGNRLRARLSRVAPQKIAAIALDEVRVTLKRLLDANDIALLSVDVDGETVRGRVTIAIAYVNLRDPATNPQNPVLNTKTVKLVT
jgi:hypothetical protein